MRAMWFLVLGLVLVPFAFAGTEYNITKLSLLDNSSYLIVNDTLQVNITPDGWTAGSCDINFSDQYEPMSAEGDSFLIDVTYQSAYDGQFWFNCSGDDIGERSHAITVHPRYRMELSWEKIPMVNVSTVYTIDAYSYNDSREEDPLSCNYSVAGITGSFSGNVSFARSFEANTNYTVWLNCSYDGVVDGSANISVTAYEPKLELLDSHAFENLSSSAGFKLGNYDFDLDYTDDVIVMGSSGLLVYDGDDLSSPVLNLSEFPLQSGVVREFFVTDMDWDGDGDILVNNGSGVYLVHGDGMSFGSPEQVFAGTNVASFGAFEIDGDFYKDVLVLNGSGQKWQYNFFQGGASFSTLESEIINSPNYRCNKILIFDQNKDNIQSLVCFDSDDNQIRIYHRENLTTNVSEFSYHNFSLPYTPSDIFFSDIDSDGVWELGVKTSPAGFGDSRGIYFYEINVSGSSPLTLYANTDTYDYDYISNDGQGGYRTFDPMNENEENLLYSVYQTTGFVAFYNSTVTNYYNYTDIFMFDTLALHDFDDDSDNDLVMSVTSNGNPPYHVNFLNNTIDLYRDLDTSYSSNITIDRLSQNISFSVNITSSWQMNNYMLDVKFYNGKVYRNDYFDSQQNLKYYLTHVNDTYSFNVNNSDANEYYLKISPNTYAMVLASATEVGKRNAACDFDASAGNWIMPATGCVDKENKYYNLSGRTWTINGNYTFTNVSAVSGSVVFNGTVNNLTDSNFTGVVANGSTIRLANSVMSGTADVSRIELRNSTGSLANIASDVLEYLSVSIIVQTDNGSTVTRDFTVDGNAAADEYLIVNNSVTVSYDINFTPSWDYFPCDTARVFDSATEVITCNLTHIPDWDYSVNTSHMTDFRNYTLLENISNISGVNLSREDVNISFTDAINLSDVNLTSLFSSGANWFNNSVAENFSYQISTNLSDFVVAVGGDVYATTSSSGVVSGTFTSMGRYNFFDNVSFAYSVASEVVAGEAFNVTLSYSDYHGNSFLNNCSLAFNGTAYNLTNISLSEGLYPWNITCNASALPFRNANGTLQASSFLVSYPSVYRYAPFSINVTYEDCSACTIAVDGSETNGCQRNETFTTLGSRAVNITCGGAQRNFAITPQDAKKLWDREEVLGRFWVEDRSGFAYPHRFIFAQMKNGLTYRDLLNSSGRLYRDDIVGINFTNSLYSIYYYSGDIHNNGSPIALIN